VIKLTDQMRSLLNSALSDGTPCLLGTASKDGYPQISPKGSIVVFDDETLCFWERSKRSALKRIEENPHVSVYYRNAARAAEIPYRAGCMRFYGDVRLVESGPQRDKIWDLIPEAERKPDPEKKGIGVLIKVNRVEELSGNVIMQRD
jgi:predicted pyridoxine 5'-phosphate oxidase superfamily flavin-nucleotide-binding protein